jgi:hypothetical protein
MPNETSFDADAAHRFFSVHCFNEAWDFIDQEERTQSETHAMLSAAHASVWHWQKRPNCTNDNLSIGYWQLSRVYALAGEPGRAAVYGQMCLDVSRGEAPFLIGYAYEALARTAALDGDQDATEGFLREARTVLERLEDPQERELLKDDLDSIAL